MIAYVAHYYGQSPLLVEGWKTAEILEWNNEAAHLENKKRDS